MFYIIFAIIGGALGYAAAPRVGADPMVGGGLGAVGGLVGGALMGTIFKVVISVIGALIGAAILLYLFKEVSGRR